MIPTASGRRGLATAALTLAALLAGAPGRAEAQFGYGFGYGFGYNQNAYSDVNYLNSRSLSLIGIAGANKPQPLRAPDRQVRDESFSERYDLATRESIVNRVARDPGREMSTVDPAGQLRANRTPPPRAAQAPAAPPIPQVVNLANFFSKDRRLIWPSVAPITGDFGPKQQTADLAALGVLNQYDLDGLASLSTATEARKVLLDYGRPALDYVRKNSTPALSDSFHVFLLSLYSNLGLAASVPRPR